MSDTSGGGPTGDAGRFTHVVGSYLDGGEGGIAARDINVTSNVHQGGATPQQRRLVQDVLDTAHAHGLAADPDVQPLLADLTSAVDADPVRPHTVRALLHEVERHAGSVAVVLTAVQLALPAFG